MVSDVVSEAFLAWFLVCFRLVYDVVSGSWVINVMSMFITFGLFFDMVSDLFLARFLREYFELQIRFDITQFVISA